MSVSSSEQSFREAAIAEGGMSVSAGARVAHVRLALESGRAVTLDLSQVPPDRRSALVAQMRELVKLAEETASTSEPSGETSSTSVRKS